MTPYHRAPDAISSEERMHIMRTMRQVDPRLPTSHRPGSPHKAVLLALRAEAGLPLWVDGDASLVPQRTSELMTCTGAQGRQYVLHAQEPSLSWDHAA